MKSYQTMLDRVCNSIISGNLEYKDTIIIGDNSSGKSDVLKRLIQNDEEEKFYFIDAVNRYFDIEQITPDPVQKINYSKEINKQRVEEDTFNYKDTFYYGGAPRAIEDFYANYSSQIKALMNEFLDISFSICQGEVGWNAYINEVRVDLSSGYQALIRIFIEILYFSDTKSSGTIVIDEVDEFLSVKNSGRVLTFLKEKFPQLHFIVTTHSADLIANAEDTNLILLYGEDFEILDAGDFSSISQVYDIFSIFFEEKEKNAKKKRDDILRRIFNNKMSEIWNSEDEAELREIKEQELTKAQKLIVKQIEEWQV